MVLSHCISNVYNSFSILTGIATVVAKIKEFITFSKPSDTMNEVLFYGSEDDDRNQQVGLNNLFCIYYIIVHASTTVDVCVPTLDSDTISKCLINVHQKNHTKVRVIVHNSCEQKKIQELLDCGIEIKSINSEVKLEHEFLLIDAQCEDAVAIIGSIDYEVHRVNCNRDTTLITSEETLVKKLKQEFERVWNNKSLEN